MPDLKTKRIETAADMCQAIDIRKTVFVIGQDVAFDREIDGLDHICDHYLGLYDQKAVATGRIRYPDQETAKIERVAVLDECQGKGFGKKLMEFMIEDVKNRSASVIEIQLGAQSHALKFYEKLDFEAFGDEFMDAGIPHYMMKKKIR